MKRFCTLAFIYALVFGVLIVPLPPVIERLAERLPTAMPRARAAATLVESNSANFAATASPTVTLANVAAGNLLAVGIAYSTTGKNINSASDTSSNAWGEVGASDIFVAFNAAGSGSTLTITLSLNASASGIVWAAEWNSSNGAWTGTADAGSAPTAGSGTSIDPTDITPAEANELVIANLAWSTGSRNLNPRPTTGWSTVLGAKHLNVIACDPQYRTNLPASAVTDTFPLSASTAWVGSLAAVKEPTGTAPPKRQLMTMGCCED